MGLKSLSIPCSTGKNLSFPFVCLHLQQFTIYIIVSNCKLKGITCHRVQSPAKLLLSMKRPKGANLKLEKRGGGGSGGEHLKSLLMWTLAVPYREEVASSLSEMVVFVSGIRIFPRLPRD